MLCFEEMVGKLKNFQNIGFLVSFHFSTDELYKKYCQTNGFNQVIKGLENLIKYNFNFTINTVVMNQNLFYLKEILEVLKKLGINKKIQYRFIDGKNVMNDYKNFVPRYNECLPFIKEVIDENEDIGIRLNEFPFCVLDEKLRNNVVFSMNPKRLNLSFGKKITTKDIVNNQFIFPNCDRCSYKLKCLGVRKEYIDIYGTKEFKSI